MADIVTQVEGLSMGRRMLQLEQVAAPGQFQDDKPDD